MEIRQEHVCLLLPLTVAHFAAENLSFPSPESRVTPLGSPGATHCEGKTHVFGYALEV